MKKLFLFIPAVMMVLTGCAKSTNQNEAGAEQDAAVEEEESMLITPDLTYAEAQGKVKTIKESAFVGMMQGDSMIISPSFPEPYCYVRYTFDEEGRLTGYSESYPLDGKEVETLSYTVDYATNPKGEAKNTTSDEWARKMKVILNHDDKGQLTGYSFGKGSDFDGQRDVTYTWTDGKITGEKISGWEDTTETTYSYDDKGKRTGYKSTGWYEGIEAHNTADYIYVVTDGKGNWTRRWIKGVSKSTDEDAGTTDTDDITIIQTREITYF